MVGTKKAGCGCSFGGGKSKKTKTKRNRTNRRNRRRMRGGNVGSNGNAVVAGNAVDSATIPTNPSQQPGTSSSWWPSWLTLPKATTTA
jgi:hypothetical protein